MTKPDIQKLTDALASVGAAHHDYQTHFLDGKHDETWPGWHAAYVLGRLCDFTTPTVLSQLLRDAPPSDDWNTEAARYVLNQI